MGTALPRKQATGQASEHLDTCTFEDTSKSKKFVNEKCACDGYEMKIRISIEDTREIHIKSPIRLKL